MDTGLNRNGVGAAEYPAMLTALRRALADEAIRLRGVMSHLVYGDDPDHPVNDLQARRFADMRAQARNQGVRYEVAHLSNSPSAMTRPDLAYDMIRPGIAVYGLSPIPERGDMGLRPAMTLNALSHWSGRYMPATVCRTATPGSPTATPHWRCCRSATPTGSTAP